MAVRVDEKTLSLLRKSGSNLGKDDSDAGSLSKELFPAIEFTPSDTTEIEDWTASAGKLTTTSDAELKSLNSLLSTRTTLLGTKPSVADIALYAHLAPIVSAWSDEQRTGANGHHHIVRYLDFVQTSPSIGLQLAESERVKIDQTRVLSAIPAIDPKAEKERKKKEKEATIAAGAGVGAAAGAAAAASSTTLPERIKDNVTAATDKIKSAVGADGSAPAAEPTTDSSSTAAAAAAAPAGSKKKEKKEKAPKPAKAAAAPAKPLSPSLIDLRVGHILKAINHPDADSLYVSTIACGDAPGTDNTTEYEGQICRTVCSGLNGLVPLAEMQGRKIVAVCNLKPVTMRGIKSAAMVLAASPRLAEGEEDKHAGPVELVELPEGAKAGDRVWFEGWEEGEPDAVLNPKKKIWEAVQPGFTTTENKEVAFDAAATEALKESGKAVGKLRTAAGLCSVKTLTGATVR